MSGHHQQTDVCQKNI